MKVWIGRDKKGPVCVGLGEPGIGPGIAFEFAIWSGPQFVICTDDANRILDGLGISLEPGEAHALELTALDYGWVMEVSDE